MTDQNRTTAASIIARAEALNASAASTKDVEQAEVLAQLIDGTVSIDDLPDDTLEDLKSSIGIDGVVDTLLDGQALQGATSVTTSQPSTPTAHRGFWQGKIGPIALAAGVMIAAGVAVPWLSHGSPATPDFALKWPGAQVGVTGLPQLNDPTRNRPATGTPDYSLDPGATLGAGGSGHIGWRRATVIVRNEDSFGSGAFITGTGWLVTNYHVVAENVQAAACTGLPAKMDVIVPHLNDGHLKPATAVPATVYRVDPERDLALLKVDTLPDGQKVVPFFPIASEVHESEDCTVIGSQKGGPAWWVRPANISDRFELPGDLSQFTAGFGTGGATRKRITVLVSDARVDHGDSGGPLLNASGQLVGLTFGCPVNETQGSVGWHIALPHLQAFLKNLPTQPEGAPFDLWTAGYADANLGFFQIDTNGDGRKDTLVYQFSEGDGAAAKMVAIETFVNLTDRPDNTPTNDPMYASVPSGLWAMPGGHFQADVCVARRGDGTDAVGYNNANGIVDEIRVGTDEKGLTQLIWKRDAAGVWTATKPTMPTPLLDKGRYTDVQWARLVEALKQGEKAGLKK